MSCEYNKKYTDDKHGSSFQCIGYLGCFTLDKTKSTDRYISYVLGIK